MAATSPKIRIIKAAAAVCALVGLVILGWITMMIYRGSEREPMLVTLGLPLVMLIAWTGLALVLWGVARAARR